MATERADDPAIRNEDELWRFVHPTQLYFDPQTNRLRPKSGAFIDRNTGEMSVDVARLTSLDVVRDRKPQHSIARFTAGDVRMMETKYLVCSDPILPDNPSQEPPNPAHAVVCPRLKERDAQKLATSETVWAFLNPPVDPPLA